MFYDETVHVNETVRAFHGQLKTLTSLYKLITCTLWMQMFYDETVYVNETVHVCISRKT